MRRRDSQKGNAAHLQPTLTVKLLEQHVRGTLLSNSGLF